MRTFKRISLPVHAVVELTAGLALIVASMALGLGPAGIAGLFLTGVVLAGLGLAAVESLPLRAHRELDRLLATLLALASIGLALSGEPVAAVVLLSVAAGQLALASVTRWTRPALR